VAFFKSLTTEFGKKTGKALGNKLFGAYADDKRVGVNRGKLKGDSDGVKITSNYRKTERELERELLALEREQFDYERTEKKQTVKEKTKVKLSPKIKKLIWGSSIGGFIVIVIIFMLIFFTFGAQEGSYPLEFDKTIGGPFSESFEVTNAVLVVKKGFTFNTKIMVEITRVSTEMPEPNNMFGRFYANNLRTGRILANIFDNRNYPIKTDIGVKSGIRTTDIPLSMSVGDVVWFKFNFGRAATILLQKEPEEASKLTFYSKWEN